MTTAEPEYETIEKDQLTDKDTIVETVVEEAKTEEKEKEDGTKETVTGEFLFTLAGNGRWYGGGYCGAPNSVIDDGLLDFVLIRKPAYSRIPGLVPKYKRGEHLSNPAFSDLLVTAAREDRNSKRK